MVQIGKICIVLGAIIALAAIQNASAYEQADGTKIQWEQGPGNAIEISARGNETWIIDRYQNVKRFDGNNWVTIPFVGDAAPTGDPISVAACRDGFAWVATDKAYVYRYDPSTRKWKLAGGGHVMPQVAAASRDSAFGRETSRGTLYNLTPTAATLYSSVNIRRASWVAMGENGEKFIISNDLHVGQDTWIIPGMKGKIYRSDGSSWVAHGGFASSMDVKSSERMVMVTDTGKVYFWWNNSWQLVWSDARSARRATINDNAVYVLTYNEEIYRAYV